MQLTLHTDYGLRVLVYLAQHQENLSTITEIADFYKISRNHLVKVVHHLSTGGFIHTTRGKNGGMKLARPPGVISIGEVVRHMEPNFDIVECFNVDNPACVLIPACALKSALHKATNEFMRVLDDFTLAEALKDGTNKIAFFPAAGLLENNLT